MNKIITLLAIILLCGQALCQLERKVAYKITLNWPVLKNYGGQKNTKQDYPLFKGDNFAISQFFPVLEGESSCIPQSCPAQPFNVGKIQEQDYKYLSKYVYRFGQNHHETTKQLWNQGSCYNQTQTKYFSDMVKVHKSLNIVKALEAKNIFPHKTRVYDKSEFAEALSHLFDGSAPYFYCGMGTAAKEGEIAPYVLRYMNIYLDKNFKPTSEFGGLCNYEYCTGGFIYPPLEF